MERIVNMKRLPAKSLNESSIYVASQRDRREHSKVVPTDPNDTRSEIDLLLCGDRSAYTIRQYQTEAWMRGEEYPMPYQIRMPEEDDVLCPELLEAFPNDAARIAHWRSCSNV
jgi:hypothetical protein